MNGPTFKVISVGTSVPRLSVSREEAAEMLGVSLTFFEKHIAGELRTALVARRRLIPVPELERWLNEHADLGNAA